MNIGLVRLEGYHLHWHVGQVPRLPDIPALSSLQTSVQSGTV